MGGSIAVFGNNRMISTKSPREIALMREAGRIVALVLSTLKSEIKVGVTTKQLDTIAMRMIKQAGAIPSFLNYRGFPAAICTSVNNTLVHGIPSDQVVLMAGDIISVDVGVKYRGYHGDSADTFTVGEVSDQAKKLIEVTKQSLFTGLAYAKAGNHLLDISWAIGNYVQSFGYSLPVEYTGHGIGSALHEEPMIPNFGNKGQGIKLKAGMTLAIEPMVHMGRPQTAVLDDDWTVVTKDGSLAAHYEHTIVILEDGYQILTEL